MVKTKVPFGQKAAFGFGMLANQMFPAALSIFMVVLVQDLGFPTWMWGILFFLPRVFDSITDPIMGFISDNTQSRWGRRRQYVLIGAVVMGIAFVVMWQLYRENGVTFNFTYFLLWSFVFYLGLTIFSVPYVAMGYEMSEDFHERTEIMAIAQWIGQWAWVIAPWFWVVMYDPNWFPNADTATRTLAVWVGVVCMLLAMVPGIFIKSESTQNHAHLTPLTLRHIGRGLKEILIGFKEAFGSTQFRKLCISTFLIFNAFNTIAAFSFFIIVYYLFGGNAGEAGIWPTLFGSLGALVTTFLVIPIVTRLSKKIGKKNAFMWSQGLSIVGYALLWFLFVPGKPWMFVFALPFFSFGIGGLFTLMMSMTADVCDLDELLTGKRREGIFGAIYWWMVKFGFAIAGLLSGFIMWLVDFTPDAPTQPEGAVMGLRIFYSGFPIIGTGIAMLVMRTYDLTESKANEIRAVLEQRKRRKGSAYYPSGKRLSLAEGGFNAVPGLVDLKGKSEPELREMFTAIMAEKLHGLCLSPYLKGQQLGDALSATQIHDRIERIAPYTSCVRSFACTEGLEMIPAVAKEHGLKTFVGAWISADLDRNEREIDKLIELGQNGLVDLASVGNEVLLREELSEKALIAYIDRVKRALPDVHVGTVDAYFQFIDRPRLLAACDEIFINCYPFWEGSHIDEAIKYLHLMYEQTKKAAGDKKVLIAETGWPSLGQEVLDAQPSEHHAIKYIVGSQLWAKANKVELFHFASYDETWKIKEEGELGAGWGLWNAEGILKYG